MNKINSINLLYPIKVENYLLNSDFIGIFYNSFYYIIKFFIIIKIIIISLKKNNLKTIFIFVKKSYYKYMIENEEIKTNWYEQVDSFDDLALNEELLRGIYGNLNRKYIFI
jgi:hypothetical protein